MSLGEYDELINTHKPKQQQRYFAMWSYKERSNYNRGARVETYNIIDCDKFDDWLENTRDEYLCFDLLIVNKM